MKMACNTRKTTCLLAAVALLVSAVCGQTVQVRGAEQVVSNEEVAERPETSMEKPEPTAFSVLDIWLSAEGGISLSWSDVGSNFVYSVEFCDSLTDQNWAPVPPIDQWPTPATNCTDTSAPGGTRFYRIYTEALYDPPSAPSDVKAGVSEGNVVITWSLAAGASSYNVYWSIDEKFSPLEANKVEDVTSPFTHSGLDYGVTYYYVVTAVGNKGESAVSSVVSVLLAPPLDTTVATALSAATEFLYTGDNPIQTGVTPGAIDPKRVAVLRSKVLTRQGLPLTGVTVSVVGQPEYGQTLTRGGGVFDMAVNGGGPVAVRYEKEGYLPVHRHVQSQWQGYACPPDVVMTPYDQRVTAVDLTAPAQFQIARASRVEDGDGSRQATLLLAQATTAELVMPDGSTQAVSALNVRATEFTVGETGPKAMPAELPPQTGYTYCVEFTADEAQDAGATDVRFDKPLYFYEENFLGFPVGGIVPVGYYDRERGVWVPSQNGRVLEILSVQGGLAELDVDGSGQPANQATLADLGITDAERERLSELYEPGQSLWRVPVTHFSPWDCNWPYGPPPDARAPNLPDPEGDDTEDDPCEESGSSIIECQNQILGERIPIVGTPFTLNYRSDRVPGRRARYTLKIPLSGDTIPPSLKGIEVEVLGPREPFRQSFPAESNQSGTFTWNGEDPYGRTIQGGAFVFIGVGYVYDAVYMQPAQVGAGFGQFGTAEITGSQAREEFTIWQRWTRRMGVWDARGQGLGGWTLSMHHAYDPSGRVLYLGDGGKRRARPEILPWVIRTVAGTGKEGFGGDGGPATQAKLDLPEGLALGPDGSLYIADFGNYRVRRVDPDGIITTVAGTGEVCDDQEVCGDGGPATEAKLTWVNSVAVGDDAGIYIAEGDNHVIRRVAPDGIITPVAGEGYFQCDFSGDGGPATEARLCEPADVAFGPDGSFYIAGRDNRVRQVGVSGIITTAAGTGRAGYSGDGGPAIVAELNHPSGIAVGPHGTLFIADTGNCCIRAVTPGGEINTVAGTGEPGFSDDGGPATQASLGFPHAVAVGPDGNVYISDWGTYRVRRLEPFLPGFSATDIVIPSRDGSELYHFDADGRHVRTLNALTGAVLYQFSYDSEGRLAAVEDGDGNVTTIERNADGDLTAIVAPFGQRTTLSLNDDGYLSTITNPANESLRLTYVGDGLLSGLTDPRGNAYRYTYNDLGRLEKTQDPAGGFCTLKRTETENGYEVVRTTAMGRTTTYSVEHLSTGEKRLVSTPGCACGGTEAVIGADGSRKVTYADGTVATLELGPDPRWGMLSPVPEMLSFTTPAGLASNFSVTRTVTLDAPEDPLSLSSLTQALTINERVYSLVYSAASRTLTVTSPEGRETSAAVDALGRVVELQVGDLEPSRVEYDGEGRLGRITRGAGADARTTSLTYESDGYLQSITDALGRITRFEYDAAGRICARTLPDGRLIHYAYDAGGNLTAITPPGRPDHEFAYTGINQLGEYIPPNVGEGEHHTLYTYDADRQLARIERPGGDTVAVGYDSAGRVSAVTLPRGRTSFSRDAATGRLVAITVAGDTLSYSYDGRLLTRTTWAGAVTGSVSRTYDNDFHITSRSVNDSDTVTFQFDADGLLVQAGDLAVRRDGEGGLVTGTTLANVEDARSYNAFGELQSYSVSFNSTDIYAATYGRDKQGRIAQKTEDIGGQTHSYSYSYDLAGRLTKVEQDGSTIASYAYDLNSNRLSYTGRQGNTISDIHDAQDRLLQHGDTAYAYGAAGELYSKTKSGRTTTYDYDALGNAMAVTLPDSTRIEYVVDGKNRRISKKVNGAVVQGFLYKDALNPVAELDGVGNVVSRFVYGARFNVPDYMVKGGTRYRIISDRLGSPRLVVVATTGDVAQRMDYDEFGNVVLDTNPGFQPFGFAGGIYDRHTGLVRFGCRDYDPAIGRWTAKDPIFLNGEDTNAYLYAGNDPVNLIDPTGRRKYTIDGVTVIIDEQGMSEEEVQEALDYARKVTVPCAKHVSWLDLLLSRIDIALTAPESLKGMKLGSWHARLTGAQTIPPQVY